MRSKFFGIIDAKQTTPARVDEENRANWVRLRTLIFLRWIAIIGQMAAIIGGQRLFNLDLDLGYCFMAVGAAVVANLIAIFVYPENQRLSESKISLMLLFDVVQLSALLFLTGGLNNPFALLILAPVTIAATTLRRTSAIFVGAVAVSLVSFVLWFHLPLSTKSGVLVQMPDIFVFGFWSAIVIGVVFLGSYAHKVTSEISSMSDALLATQMALAREQKIADLTGVVAAAAHELGTPLATIKLASSELMDELERESDMHADAELIHDQADRCRDILQSMGRAGKEDLQIRFAPLTEVIREAAEPHENRGKTVEIFPDQASVEFENQPNAFRRPEIIHGLRNLIQNAVDFADTQVWIEAVWSAKHVTVRIIDDGKGFPQQIIGRIGDPFVGRRRTQEDLAKRPEYQGMGLGLFIAKTLLERSGAELSFANGREPHSSAPDPGQKHGAIVEVIWPRAMICPDGKMSGMALGKNRVIEP